MMNNFRIVFVASFLLFTTIIYGQRHPDNEKIKSLKIGYITERLNLTSDEAIGFWPIYNAHEEQLSALRKKEHDLVNGKLGQGINSPEAMALTEKEALAILQKQLLLQKNKFDLEEKFFKKLTTVIPAKKILILTQVENRFKRRLLKQYRKKGSRPSGGGPR